MAFNHKVHSLKSRWNLPWNILRSVWELFRGWILFPGVCGNCIRLGFCSCRGSLCGPILCVVCCVCGCAYALHLYKGYVRNIYIYGPGPQGPFICWALLGSFIWAQQGPRGFICWALLDPFICWPLWGPFINALPNPT